MLDELILLETFELVTLLELIELLDAILSLLVELLLIEQPTTNKLNNKYNLFNFIKPFKPQWHYNIKNNKNKLIIYNNI